MMDSASAGAESQSQVPSSKPRPPPVARKPKPQTTPKPEKPSLAQKPSILPKKPTLNGTDEQQVEETHVTKHSTSDLNSNSTCTQSSDHSSGVPIKTSQEKPVVARPKEPPPPLPKTPPKVAAQQKTPPPIPRQPPKGQGGAKGISQSFKTPGDKPLSYKVEAAHSHLNGNKASSNEDISKESKAKVVDQSKPVGHERKSPVIPPVKPKPRRKTIDTVIVHDRENEVNGKTIGCISNEDLRDKKKDQRSVLEREISVGRSTWFHAEQDTSNDQTGEEDSVTVTDADKNGHSKSKNHVIERVTSVGNSTWFVESRDASKESSEDEIIDKDGENHEVTHESKPNTPELNREKPASPAPNKTPPPVPKKIIHRTPPPIPKSVKHVEPNVKPVEPSVKPLEPNTGDIDSATSNDKSFSCDNQKTDEGESEESEEVFSAKVSKVESAIKQGLKGGQPKPKPRASISSAKSIEKLPLVIPKKPIPPAKLLPTPKKRTSINRLSGSDQVSTNKVLTGSLENLTDNSKEKQEDIHKIVETDQKSVLNIKSKIDHFQNEEKQYRVIDKSILGASASNQKTEIADNSTQDIKKDLPQNTDDSSVNVSVVELRKKFKENKQTAAQIDVPKTDHDAHNVSDTKDDSKSSSNHTPSSLKGSFDDLLADKSILEPSSLLNEIEEILSRSYKHSSLTRSGSSPEKRAGIALHRDTIDVKSERSLSLDLTPEQKTSTPIRPPRPKKAAKRLRSQSQIIYDTCASDTESLPDLSITHEEELKSLKDDLSKTFTLGPAKPHPPKPKRNKLMKVQRSYSDITKMKSFLEQKEMAEHKNSPISKQGVAGSSESIDNNKGIRAKRPTRKAPPPPVKVTPKTSVDLNAVVPVDSCVKSMNMEKGLSQKSDIEDTAGSIYDSIKDVEVPYSSDEDHDYHEIPEHLRQRTGDSDSRSKSGSPPKLPPRNYSNSNSFDSSSQSGFVCDISITDTVSSIGDITSSVEDLSVSSAVLKAESRSGTQSPSVKKRQKSKPLPSPLLHKKLEQVQNLDSNGLSGSNLSIPESLPDSTGSRTRPVSNASEMEVTSSDSEGEDEEVKIARKKEKKLFLIAQEVVSSERVFVDVLRLLNVDFRKHISDATENLGRPVIPSETLNRILDYLPQLQNFNEDLLKDLEERISQWDTRKAIADIFVKKGPFLKLYTSYIRDFETMTATLDEAIKKYPAFQAALKEFELSERCEKLALKHYMLKPIQRIPQYRLLLQDYMKHMPSDSPEMKDMQTALNIVSEVAEHANENMRHGDYVQKMLEIQRSLIGQFEVIKPGRIFLKEGELMKLSRKEMQPRYFFLFSDVLLYTTPVTMGYKVNNVLPLAGMKVSVSGQDDFKNEFSIVSVQRSFTLSGSTLEERDDWVSALNSAIDENALKRNTFEAVRAGTQTLLDKDFVLGHKPPIWIPDARVTMCMLCTCEFTVTWRRHHCRACGRVVCGNCSDCKAPLRYLKYKEGRVCDECFKILSKDKDIKNKDGVEGDQNDSSASKEGDDSWLSINGLFERFGRLRLSKGADKKLLVYRPKVLTEVTANDQGATMSGYLHKLHKAKKWKKLWFVLKDKVLYQFKATQDQAAADQMVLLGYEVVRFTEFYEGVDPGLLFQLTHSNMPPIVFKTDSATATEKWVTVMREASVA